MWPRALRGFFIDFALAGIAGALGWHPVYAFVASHAALLYWSSNLLHIVLIPFLLLQALVGNTRGADLVSAREGPLHERLYIWSTVLTFASSFIVPFVCGIMLPVETSLVLAMAATFAPVATFMLLGSAAMSPALRKRDLRIWSPFASRAGSLAVGAAITLYLAVAESLLFMCVESTRNTKVTGLCTFLGLVLSYLPVRLFLFYNVTKSESRVEVASLFASVAFLGVQLRAAASH